MYRCKQADSGANCGNMIIPDLALIYDFTIDETTRFINCDPSGSALTCDKSDTYDLVDTYSKVNRILNSDQNLGFKCSLLRTMTCLFLCLLKSTIK